MRANEDMMPKLSICHGHGSKMNFSVSDYIRGDTAYLSLHHLCIKDNVDLLILRSQLSHWSMMSIN